MAKRRPAPKLRRAASRRIAPGRRPPREPQRRLRLESLEDRRMMAFVVPTLNSLPGAPNTLFLDFDGAPAFDWVDTNGATVRAKGPGSANDPIPAFTIDMNATDFTTEELAGINAIWASVAEKYSPFNVNVTTVDPGAYNDNQTARVIIGGRDDDWHAQDDGGVASIGGFTRADRDNTSFVFSRDAIGYFSGSLSMADRRYLGETAAHEAGHTFGLIHQQHRTGPMTVDQYYDGNGTWVPIMGDSGNRAGRGVWWRTGNWGQDSPDALHDEINELTSLLGSRIDDHSFPGGNPTLLNNDNQGNLSGSGIIGHPFDQDAFRFLASSSTVSFTVSNATNGGMLSPRAEMRTYSTNLPIPTSTTVAADGNSVTVSATNLTIGQFYVIYVTSDFNYGSLGQYTIAGTQQLFATLNNGVLTVNGFDNVNDDIQFDLYFLDPTMLYVDNAINGNPSQVAAALFPWSDVNSIVINTGSGDDTVRFLRSLPLAETTLNMGAGVDTVDVRGYDYSETFSIQPTLIDWGYQTITYGGDVESVIARGNLGDDTFYVGDLTAAFTIYGGGNNDSIYLAGVPTGPSGLQSYVYPDDGNDTITIAARDALGNLAVDGTLTVIGSNGTDSVTINDSAGTTGIHYQMAGGTITGIGTGAIRVSGNEQLTFLAGSGDDSWTTLFGPLFNPPTTIHAGSGNNTFHLDASLSPALWTLYGGPDQDSLYMIDTLNTAPSTTWTMTPTSLTRRRSDGGGTKTYNHSSIENVTVDATAGVDIFYVDGVGPGQALTLNAGAGLDGMYLGSLMANDLDAIRGPVAFHAQADGGNMAVLDGADPTGDIVHLTQSSLGAYPGDTLFGEGGSLVFSDVSNFGVNPGITLNLGTGADTIYAQPMPTARYTINAGDPVSLPGDQLVLQLELAAALDPVISNPSAPTGNVTSSNLQTLNWTGIDGPVTVQIPGDFDGDGLVGAADLDILFANMGISAAGDADGDGDTDGADYLVWQRRQGQVAELPALAAVEPAVAAALAAEAPANRRDATRSTTRSTMRANYRPEAGDLCGDTLLPATARQVTARSHESSRPELRTGWVTGATRQTARVAHADRSLESLDAAFAAFA
jgi:hypothetical protein